MLEVGVANGGTTIGVYEFCQRVGRTFLWTGLDMECGRPAFNLGKWGRFICGDFHTPEVYKQIEGNCNLLFIDGCHCQQCCALDFTLYAPKVEPGGIILFHDTCDHPDWQDHHTQCKPDRFIGTRAALKELGLCPLIRPGYQFIGEQNEGRTQGMMAFQRL